MKVEVKTPVGGVVAVASQDRIYFRDENGNLWFLDATGTLYPSAEVSMLEIAAKNLSYDVVHKGDAITITF